MVSPMKMTAKKVDEAIKEDLYNYDLVCFGSPVHHSLPPTSVFKFIKKTIGSIGMLAKCVYPRLKLLIRMLLFFAPIRGLTVG